jgi:glycine/D-amino acid oxidase-like deaminating enzyme
MIRTRYGVSPWIEEVSPKRRPSHSPYRGSASFPVVIVGGGLCGAMTAYALAAAGVRVALLEADRLGLRGAGRAPGVVQADAAPSFREVETRHGRRAARAVFEASRRAVLDLAATTRRLGIKADLATHDALRLVASFTANEKLLVRESAARREAGVDAVWLKAPAALRESSADGVRAGIRLHGWGQANPYRLVNGFAAAAAARGAAIFERSAVRRMTVRRKDVEVTLDGGTVLAGTVVVCTGEPTHLHRSLERHMARHARYVALTDRLPSTLRKRIAARTPVVTDTETPAHTIRWMDDGRVVVAGADQRRPPLRGNERIVVQRTGQLMYELSRLYSAISGVIPTHGWDVPVGATADGLMYAGLHRNFPRQVFAWTTTHDPAQAFLASRIVLRHCLGEPDKDDHYFAFARGK